MHTNLDKHKWSQLYIKLTWCKVDDGIKHISVSGANILVKLEKLQYNPKLISVIHVEIKNIFKIFLFKNYMELAATFTSWFIYILILMDAFTVILPKVLTGWL